MEAPPSLSVYRGHSRSGIGEGPDSPVARGEQYLAAAPQLEDAQTLRLIRPWMTHDFDPAHLRETDGELEGWSVFRMEEYRFVVRLVSAGLFTDRAAYFAHGRAWRLGEGRRGFDPGGLLGASEAFEEPWRDGDRSSDVPVSWPGPVRPDQIREEEEVAVRFLARLYQCRIEERPLVVAAPVPDFRAGGPLHALVSLARAALPEHLKRDCSVRVYTRLPELFLNQLGAGLVALPKGFAGEALSIRRDAVILDRQGECHSSQDLDPRAESYARAVVSRVLALPGGLMLFSERFRDRSGGLRELPGEDELRTLTLTYNLAFAFAGPEDSRGDLLEKFLVPQAEKHPDLPWERLIDAEEWPRFPAAALERVALRPLENGRGLQERVEEAMATLSLTVDDHLDDWWDAEDRGKRRRLLELFCHQPPLASARELARRTVDVPLADVEPRLVATILRAELESGVLERRSGDSRTLADLAGEPDVLEVLGKATSKGALPLDWARHVVEAPGHPEDPQRLAEHLLPCIEEWPNWGDLPRELVRRLLADGATGAGVIGAVGEAARRLEPADAFEDFLDLAELEVRAGAREGPARRKLRESLPELTGPEAWRRVIEVALSPRHRALEPADLTARGEPRLPVNRETAEGMLRVEIVEHLSTPALLRLGRELAPDDGERLRLIYQDLDRRMADDLEATTRDLIAGGWWLAWRRRPTVIDGKQASLAWLRSPIWLEETAPEPTREAWKQAMSDLRDGLTLNEMAEITHESAGHPRVRWPWAPPFEEYQVAELAGLVQRHLDGLAYLAEAIRADRVVQELGKPAHQLVLAKSLWEKELPADTLLWLLEPKPGERRPQLDHAQARCLIDNTFTERLHQRALGARPPEGIPVGAGPSRPPLDTSKLTDRVVDALDRQRPTDPCWADLAAEIGSFRRSPEERTEHPMSSIARRVRQLKQEHVAWGHGLERFGWSTFDRASEKRPSLFAAAPDPTNSLPALELAASLAGDGALGIATLGVIFAAGSYAYRKEDLWWYALLRGLREALSEDRSAGFGQSDELVLTLVLERATALSSSQRQAFERVLLEESRNWSLVTQTGVLMS